MAKRSVQINVMMTPEGAKKLDQERKFLNRSEYIRQAMGYAIRMGFKVNEEMFQ